MLDARGVPVLDARGVFVLDELGVLTAATTWLAPDGAASVAMTRGQETFFF